MIVLGIESSCDETAAALVEDGKEILSSVVASQISVHREYGGVVPELASREHVDNICYVVEEALRASQVAWDGFDAAGEPLPSGVYFCHLRLGTRTETMRVALVR